MPGDADFRILGNVGKGQRIEIVRIGSAFPVG
jgi:hypothetical protein